MFHLSLYLQLERQQRAVHVAQYPNDRRRRGANGPTTNAPQHASEQQQSPQQPSSTSTATAAAESSSSPTAAEYLQSSSPPATTTATTTTAAAASTTSSRPIIHAPDEHWPEQWSGPLHGADELFGQFFRVQLWFGLGQFAPQCAQFECEAEHDYAQSTEGGPLPVRLEL